MDIRDYLEVREDPAEPVFHYTSVSNLPNILESGSLWATDIQYMNDSKELRHGIEVLDQLLVQQMPGLPEKQTRCAIQLQKWLAHGAISRHHIFATCLTEKGNLLSQWRGYCTPGKGVSFGFSPEELREIVDEQDFKLARVIYSREDQNTMMGYLVDLLMEAVNSYTESNASESHPTESFFKLFTEWEDTVAQFCAMMKHHAFSDEAEWRAISRPIQDLQDDRIQFRDGALSLTPYIDFHLPKNGRGGVSLQKVFLGPTANQTIAFRAVDTLLTSKKAHPRDGLFDSQISLRN